jgi:FtsH-binding integral membrane protein
MNTFLSKVYANMLAGLALTSVSAYLMTNYLYDNFTKLNSASVLFIIFLPLILAILGIFILDKMNGVMAKIYFAVYSIAAGLSISFSLMQYTGVSIVSTFIICSVMFAILSVVGRYNLLNLKRIESYVYIALVCLIIASVINLFIGATLMSYLISFVGIVIFTVFTIIDTEKIGDYESMENGDVFAALHLYLDFINLFLSLLRFFGDKD